MTIINSINTGLESFTGTGNFLGSNSPTITTPNLGNSTATSLTLSSTIGIIGVSSGAAVTTGCVGEIININVSLASAVPITTTNIAQDIISMSLTAGDWDVFGNVYFSIPNTATTNILGWISTTSATQPDNSLLVQYTGNATDYVNSMGFPVPYIRALLASTTTIHLSASCTFSSSGVKVCGNLIARRAR